MQTKSAAWSRCHGRVCKAVLSAFCFTQSQGWHSFVSPSTACLALSFCLSSFLPCFLALHSFPLSFRTIRHYISASQMSLSNQTPSIYYVATMHTVQLPSANCSPHPCFIWPGLRRMLNLHYLCLFLCVSGMCFCITYVIFC